MGTAVLERRPLVVPEAIRDTEGRSHSELAEQCARKLGYSGLKDDEVARWRADDAKRESVSTTISLARGLEQAGIIPLTEKSVLRYKRKVVTRSWCETVAAFLTSFVGGLLLLSPRHFKDPKDKSEKSDAVGILVVVVLLATALFAGLPVLLCYFCGLSRESVLWAGGSGAALACFARLVNLYPPIARMIDRVCDRLEKYWVLCWVRHEISEFKAPMPPRVARNALRLKEIFGSRASFMVEVATPDPKVMLNCDPFLILKFGDQEVYVDVWDENDFTSTR